MKHTARISLILLAIFTLIFFSARERGIYTFWHSNVKRLSSEEGLECISDTKPIIIDARTPQEFKTSHLENALLFNQELIDTLSKETPLLIYCTVGVRSNNLANQLSEKRIYRNLRIKEGILGWANDELPLVNEQGAITDKIHVYSKFFTSFLKNGKAVYQ